MEARRKRQALAGLVAQSTLTRVSSIRVFLVGGVLAMLALAVQAQSQSNYEYTYDAAGKVIGVIRLSTPMPDLTVDNLSLGVISANTNAQ